MIKMKKGRGVSILLLFMLVFQLVLPVNFAFGADDLNDITIIITNEAGKLNGGKIEGKLTITDPNTGKEIKPTGDKYLDVPKDAVLKIKYDFALPIGDDYTFEVGNYFVIDIPEGINFKPPVKNQILDKENRVVATYETTSGNKIKVTFTDYVEFEDSIKGGFDITGTFNEDASGTEGEKEYDFKYAGKIKVVFEKEEPPKSEVKIKKSGKYNSDGTIDWIVVVIPSKETENVSITDIFGNNQEYVDGSFATVTSGGAINYVTTGTALKVEKVNRKITYDFGSISEEQEVRFKTKPLAEAFSAENKDNENVIFINNASVLVDSKEVDKTEARVNINWIEKGGALDAANKRIKWTINFNTDGYTIADPKITDYILSDELEYVAGTAELKIGGTTTPINPVVSTEGEKTKLEFQYSGPLNKSATLTYDTEIKNWDNYIRGNALKTFDNEAELTWNGNIYGTPSDSDTVTAFGAGGILNKRAQSSREYNDKNDGDVIEWTIQINRNKAPLTGKIVFSDIIPNGLAYENNDGDFEIVGVDEYDTIGAFSYNDVTRTVKFEFKDNELNVKTYTIKIKTRITDKSSLFSNKSDVVFSNTATVTGTAIKDESASGPGKQYFNSQVIEKSVKQSDYNYATREVEWKIVINRNELFLKNAKLTDIIPTGMEYVQGTFKITDPNDAIYADDNLLYNNNILEYSFGDISKKYTVTFKTKVTDEGLQTKDSNIGFKNVAKLTSENFAGTVEDDATIYVNNPIVEKVGKSMSGGDYIEWEVPINSNSIALSNVILSDKLDNALILDRDSVKLYTATHSAIGSNKLKIDSEVASTEYEFEYDEDEDNLFVFKFKKSVSSPYILKFNTSVTREGDISNSIEFKANGITGGQTSSSTSVSVTKDDNWGGGTTGNIKITKLDDYGNPLSDAEFKVYRIDKSGNIVGVITAKSGAGGVVLFSGLHFKTFYIEEINAPDGYLRDGKTEVTLLTPNNYSKEFTFINEKIYGDVEFIKHDELGNELKGAKFQLTGNGENRIVTSDEDGIVKFEKVPAGDYQIKEIESPYGYKLSDKVIDVNVGRDDTQTKVVVKLAVEGISIASISNELKDVYGNVEIDKIGVVEYKDGTKREYPLQGSEFSIKTVDDQAVFDKDGNEVNHVNSDINGKVVFNNIPVGEYVVKEISAPSGYLGSNEKVYVEIKRSSSDLEKADVTYALEGEGYTSEVREITNKSTVIEFIKKDSSGYLLLGAEFTLYASDGTTVFENRQPVSSDVEGRIIFESIPAGTYTIKETKAPSGYKQLDKEIKVEVSVVDNEPVLEFSYVDGSESVTGENGEFIVVNEKKPSGGKDPDPVFGKIVVKKVDEDKKVLEGAEFTLYDSNGKVVARATTGKDGVVSFEKLEKGSYVLKETKAPVGYVLDIEETDVEIKGSETKTFTFTNKKEEPKKPGRVEIIKTDEDGKLLSDARFALVNSDGETVKTVTTVNGHAAFENVPVGRYKIKEVQAPEGYELSTNTISVTVESEQTVTVRVENRLIDRPTTPVDPDKPGVPKTGSISIFKVDENTKPLAGAEFTLYNENNQIIGTAVSGSDGKVVFSNLKEGIYHVVETNAPDGYALVDDILIVNVDEAKTYSYRFRNVTEELLIEDPDIPLGWETIDDPDVPTGTIDPTNPDGKLPNTGSIFNTWLLAAVGFVLIFAGLFIKKRRVLN